jgi:hypothetical protein
MMGIDILQDALEAIQLRTQSYAQRELAISNA